MNWRNRCYGFNTFEILYLEKIEKLQSNLLTLNEFLIEILTLLIQRIKYNAQQNSIPFSAYRRKSPLSPAVCRLFLFLKWNVNDLDIINK